MNAVTTQRSYFSRKQASQYLSLSLRVIDYAKRHRKLKFARIGRKILFKKSDLDRFVEQRIARE